MKIKNNKIIKTFSLLATGTILAQLVSVLISPVLSRLYSPEEMGIYTLVFTAVSTFGPILTLKYDMGLVVTESEEEENALINISLKLLVALSSIIGALYVLFVLKDNFNVTTYILFTILLVLILMFYGVFNLLFSISNKYRDYRTIANMTVIKSWSNSLFSILSGLIFPKAISLLVSQLLSYFLSTIREFNKRELLSRQTASGYEKLVAKEYKNQPLFNAPAALTNTLIYSSINIFIAYAYTSRDLGIYSLSYRILGLPFSVISSNVTKIYFDYASKEKRRTGNYKEIFKKTLLILIIIVFPLMLLLSIIAPRIVEVVFGNEWLAAGLYIQVLAPMFGMKLIVDSLSTSYIIAGKQSVELFLQIVLLIGEGLVFTLSILYNVDLIASLTMISLLYCLIYSFSLFIMYKNSYR